MAKLNIGSLFGDTDLDNMLNRVDTLVDTLSKQRQLGIDKDITDSALREVLTAIEEKSNPTDDGQIESLLNKLSISPERLNRYNTYDEIYRAVQLLKRIVTVYINNCLQRDILTGKAISLKQIETTKNKETIRTQYKDFSMACIDHFKLERKLSDNILQSILRYGDHFIEIIDLKTDIIDFPSTTSPSVITENISYIENRISKNGFNLSTKDGIISDCSNKLYNMLIEVNDGPQPDTDINSAKFLYELNDGASTKEFFNKVQLNQIVLKFHKPHKICILSVEDTILGYVEIKEKISSDRSLGVGARFASMVNQLNYMKSGSNSNNSAVAKDLVHKIVFNIIKKIGLSKDTNDSKSKYDINKEYEGLIHKSLGDDLFYMVKKLLYETDFDQGLKKLAVRFIAPDRMIRFVYNPIEYTPYGTSILDALVYPAKLYLLNQLTNTVSKLSRAALIRKWTIETGPREYHSNQIQKLKRELKNQRVTVDDIMSFKSVPKVLSDFKDVIIVSKKGQKFVDFELQSMHDSNIKIADLEDQRRELIALSGIPAPYLGYNDVIELREQLVHVNVTFATEIISIQSQVNEGLSNVIDKIAKILNFSDKPSQYNIVSLKVPVVLLLQMIETIMSSISNIQQNFQASQIDFDPTYLLKLYVPSLDWDEFLKAGREYKILKQTSIPPIEQLDGQSQGGY
jgi:hypothetical protein